MEQSNRPRVEVIERSWQPDAILWVPDEDRERGFIIPAFGDGNYWNAGREILSRDLDVPSGEDNALLLHATYCSGDVRDPTSRYIKDKMLYVGLFTFNKNLWTSEGVYVVHDPKGTCEDELQEKLEEGLEGGEFREGVKFSKDGRVRFAPVDSYRLGEHTPEELAENGYVIANYGVEGAKMLAEVARKFEYNPLVGVAPIDVVREEPLTTFASIGLHNFHKGLLVAPTVGRHANGFGVVDRDNYSAFRKNNSF